LKRPIGVFIAGVILLVSGLLGLVLFSLGVLGTMATSSLQTTMTPAARAVVYVTEASFAAFSVFCGWVAIDLFRLRAWARYASIVLAALAACFFGLSAILLTLLRNMPLPEQNLPPHLIEHIFLGLALLYFVIAAIGLFWVVYFNRASIRGAFAAAEAHRQGEDAFGGVILPNDFYLFKHAAYKEPFFFWYGRKDPNIAYSVVTNEAAAFKAAGFPFELDLRPFDSGSYQADYSSVNAAVWAFFQKHTLPASIIEAREQANSAAAAKSK